MNAVELLDRVHRTLWPEEWMSPQQRAEAIESGVLDSEGSSEWSAETLEEVARILRIGVAANVIRPRGGYLVRVKGRHGTRVLGPYPTEGEAQAVWNDYMSQRRLGREQ